jgi:hypothetical protein
VELGVFVVVLADGAVVGFLVTGVFVGFVDGVVFTGAGVLVTEGEEAVAEGEAGALAEDVV